MAEKPIPSPMNTMAQAMAGIDQRAYQTSHQRVWQALINPTRAVEVRTWLRKHADEALMLRGQHDETMMHWAVLSEWALVLDLLSAGLSVNAVDRFQRTPWDWLAERFWITCITQQISLPEAGRAKLQAQTEDLGLLLWRMGGRSGRPDPKIHPGLAWTRGGAWGLLEGMRDTEEGQSTDFWRGWPVQGRSVLHAWVLAPETSAKHQQLKRMLTWGLSVDEPDEHGRTPLWHAVDAWLARPELEPLLKPAMSTLIEQGADWDREDDQEVSPRMVPHNHPEGWEAAEKLESWALTWKR